jgi:hypothetical protein
VVNAPSPRIRGLWCRRKSLAREKYAKGAFSWRRLPGKPWRQDRVGSNMEPSVNRGGEVNAKERKVGIGDRIDEPADQA